ncbi:MAG: hypothetical protein KBD05_02230 [Candidatus Pacebacteria bacterium]|nr:hypothetical protein [Candidatus Paceibacterota bacterium]
MSSLRNWLAGAAAVLVLAVPSYASAQSSTIAELQALIAQLLAQLAALQEEVSVESYALVGVVSEDDPLLVTFKYTMNQSESCDGGRYRLHFGDDGLGNELRFDQGTCNAYTQYTEHEYDEDGTYTATLYETTNFGERILQTTTVVVGDESEVRRVSVAEVRDNGVKVRYQNLPEYSYIELFWLNEDNRFRSITRSQVPNGGDGSKFIELPSDAPSGTYIASARKLGTDMIVDSDTFTIVQDENGVRELLEAAWNDIEDAWEDLNDADDNGMDTADAEATLQDADDLLEEAEELLDDGDTASALDLIVEAQDLIDRALVLLGEDEESLEIIDVEVEVNDPDEGPAPLTIVVTGQVEAQEDGSCPIEFPDTTLDWGDGTTGSVMAQAVSTASGGSGCRQTLTQSYTHTYTTPGTYLVSYIAEGHRRDTARIDVTGTVIPREPVPSCTVTADDNSVSAGQSVLLTWASKNTSYVRGPNGEQLAPNGSKSYQVTSTTTFGFTAYGISGGKVGCSTTVSVDTPAATPTLSFTGPRLVLPGEPATLSWSTTNAQRCVLSDNFGMETKVQTGNAEYDAYPYQTTTYRLWCANDPGTGKDGPAVEKSLTVRVIERTNRGQLPAAALTSITGQLDVILKGFKELFGN